MLEKQDFQTIAETFNSSIEPIKEEMRELKGEVLDVKGEVQEVRDEVQEIRLTLENETNRNINLIAEGHLNLSWKLDEALKVENEKEMLLIRVNHLESEVRRIKNRVEAMA